MSDTPVQQTPIKVTVTLSPAIQQSLIKINAPILAAVAALKELGLTDASVALAAGKPLMPQTLHISPMAAGQLRQALSRVLASDPIAAEAGALFNSIPPAMRNRPSMARPMPTRVTSPNRAPTPKPATKTTPTKAK